MVLLVVKGTKFHDEFVYNCPCDTLIGPLAKTLAHIQNMRHRVRLQVHSANDLIAAAKTVCETKAAAYEAEIRRVHAILQDPKSIVTDGEFDDYWTKIKDATVALFPKECVHKDGEAAAVDFLYQQHDNPDLDEDHRLHIYHCRAILDPKYRLNECLDEETCAMWFCAKEMSAEEKIGKYCGNNEKSKVTVKLSKSNGAAPSKEPTMNYADQRLLRAHLAQKRQEFTTLEEPELRDRVIAKTKAEMRVGGSSTSAAASNGGGELRTAGIRHIFNNRQETIVEGAA